MDKMKVYETELAKLVEIFSNVDESKKKLVEGLIDEAAFLYSENIILKDIIKVDGMVKVHPKNIGLQKQTEAGKQYLKNINCYAVVIKALNSVLNNTNVDEADPVEEWIKSKKNNK